ncbi:hypothetical protein [Variovorax paradoxus]|uniref:Uncharacterized protein n=1 Tax=Variovorax paradoxus TaxID=34073 RepID=A0A679JCS9_VARPD|nr:hypothetical protein VVAX_05005 [Variovorax paradoxus]
MKDSAMAKSSTLTAAEMRKRIDARRDSNREHTRKYRERQASSGSVTIQVTVPQSAADVLRAVVSAIRPGSPTDLVEAANALTEWSPPDTAAALE